MASDWAFELLRKGLAWSTMTKYVEIMAGLINNAARAGIVTGDGPFNRMRTVICGSKQHYAPVERSIVDRFVNLMKAPGLDGEPGMWRDVILFSLLNRAMPFEQIAALTRDSRHGSAPRNLEIIRRNISPGRRKYVFDLGQSALTPRQLKKRVEQSTLVLLQSQVSTTIKDPWQFVADMWLTLALDSGCRLSQALGCLPDNHTTVVVPDFALRADIDQAAATACDNAVAAGLECPAPVWHVLKMRPRVRYSDLEQALKETPTPATLFYPLDEITRRIGSKKTVVLQPFISGVVFVRTAPQALSNVMACLASYAVCMRTGDAPAKVRDAEMHAFQRAIGRFTPDTEIHPLHTLIPAPGDKVIVLGGVFAGLTGTYQRPVPEPGTGRTLYRIIFRETRDGHPAHGIEWETFSHVSATIDPRQIQPHDP